MVALKEKIKASLDHLQSLMENNVHLKDYLTVATAIDNSAKYFSVLSEEDREYIDAARYALENQMEWKV